MRTGAEGPRFATGRERGAEVRNGIVKRYFFTCVSVVLVSIVVLGAVFLGLSAQYFKDERQDQLLIIAQRAAERTSSGLTTSDGNSYLLDFDTLRQGYRLLISTQEDADLFMTDVNGAAVLCTEGTRCAHTTYRVPADVLEKSSQASVAKGYRGMGTLGEIYKRPHYIVSVPITGDDGYIIGYVFAASPADELSQFLVDVLRMFAIAAVVVLAISFAVIYYTTKRLVSPLKEMAGYAARFGQGDFSQTVPVTSDDEVGQLAMALNNMSSSLAVVEQTRRNFVANVSHELKTPMTTIGGFVDGILDGTIPPERQNHYLGLVSNEVKRLSRLVSGMLNVSKIEAGEMTLNTVPFNICEVIFTALLSFEQQIEQKSIEIEGLDVDKVMVEGDRDLVHQVIYNLVDNAVKFVNEGGVISFGFETVGGYTFTAVRNSGEGIPKEQLQQVFDRFYKTDRSRGLDKKGVGLGLYIAKTIVNRHGGDIVVSSKEGEYTEFRFSLPAAKPLRAKRAAKGEGRREGQPADAPAEAEGQQAPDPGDGDRKI